MSPVVISSRKESVYRPFCKVLLIYICRGQLERVCVCIMVKLDNGESGFSSGDLPIDLDAFREHKHLIGWYTMHGTLKLKNHIIH